HEGLRLRRPELTEHIPLCWPFAHHLFHCIKQVLRQAYYFAGLIDALALLGKNWRIRSHVEMIMQSIPEIAWHDRCSTFHRKGRSTARHIGLAPKERYRRALSRRQRTVKYDADELILVQHTQNSPYRTLHRNDIDTFLFALILYQFI